MAMPGLSLPQQHSDKPGLHAQECQVTGAGLNTAS